MTKFQQAICWAFGVVGFIIVLIIVNMPCCIPIRRTYTCESLYLREVRRIDRALTEYIRNDKPFPTLDEMVADGVYTFPQDTSYRAGDYPIDPHDFRVKLFPVNHPYKADAYKVFVTSTNGGCAEGQTLVYSSADYEGQWLENRSAH